MSSNVRIETGTEVECLDGSPDGERGTYSRRLQTQLEEFRKFARWNSSLLYVIGFMIILVCCSGLAYFFLYNKDVSGESPQEQSELTDARDPQDPNLKLITLTFEESKEIYCSVDEIDNISLKLTAENDGENWEEWLFGCKGTVVQLSLEGPFSSEDLINFDNLFGNTTRKIQLLGSEICSSSQSLKLNNRIFKQITSLELFNSTELCDGLLGAFLEDIPKTLTTVQFNSVVVSQKVESYIKNLISSKQISQMQLQDLQYIQP